MRHKIRARMRSPEAPIRSKPSKEVEVEQKVEKKVSKRKLLKKKLKESSVSGSRGAQQHSREMLQKRRGLACACDGMLMRGM